MELSKVVFPLTPISRIEIDTTPFVRIIIFVVVFNAPVFHKNNNSCFSELLRIFLEDNYCLKKPKLSFKLIKLLNF